MPIKFYRITVQFASATLNSGASIRMSGFHSRDAAEQYRVKFGEWNVGYPFLYTVEECRP